MEAIVTVPKLYLFLGVFLGICLLVILAIIMDLWDGVYTARRIGERIHSHKLRVTLSKISEYFRFIAIGFLVDCVGMLFPFYFMPFVAMLFGVGLTIVEAKSMFEHARKRHSVTVEVPDIIRSIIACAKEKDAHALIEEIEKRLSTEKGTIDYESTD